MEVIILAGGFGTRLRSVVNEVPKCMAPIANKPFLWYLLKYLTKFDVSKVILSLGYLRGVIIDWIDECKDEFPFAFEYAVEDEPLGTGGGIKLALKRTSKPNIIVLNGDTFFDVNLNELCEDTNQIRRFDEKKYCEKGLINGGIYIINTLEPIFDRLPQRFSFETGVLQPQCLLGKLYGVVQNGYFIDIGIPEDYDKANAEFSDLLF